MMCLQLAWQRFLAFPPPVVLVDVKTHVTSHSVCEEKQQFLDLRRRRRTTGKHQKVN